MKCDTCKFNYKYILSADECGAGSPTMDCLKGHWGNGNPFEEHPIDVDDPWKNCNDYLINPQEAKDE